MGFYDDALALADRGFVGRTSEIAGFEALLEASEARVLWVFGPGGIGKSRLLTVLAGKAEAACYRVVSVDFRSGETTGRDLTSAVLNELETIRSGRVVVVLDALEPSAGIERWLRYELLPTLPSGSIVLIASRQPPNTDWRADPAWSALLELIPLRGLSPDEGHKLLTLAGVPAGSAPKAAALGHGHPLALRLLAETLTTQSAGTVPDAIDHAPDLVASLLTRMIGDIPDEQRRLAVELASIARVTTRSLLRECCTADRADHLFNWLAAQPWIDRIPGGLCPHDLARVVIEADLRNNDPDRHAVAKRAVRTFVLDPERARQDPDRCATDFLYLHRQKSVLSSAWDWMSFGDTEMSGVRGDDRDALAELVASSYGAASVQVLDHWLNRQPRGFAVLRSLGDIIGFTAMFVFDEPTADDLAADPSVAAIWDRAMRRGRPRKGQMIGLSRFVCDKVAGTFPPSPTYNAVTVLSGSRWFTAPDLSLDYIVKPRGGSFKPMMDYIDFHPVDEADHLVGDTEMVVFEHDWRDVPIEPWLDRMEELEGGAPLPPATDRAPVLNALDETAFAEAVRAALRDLAKPAKLADNPLTTSRVVRDTTGDDGPDALSQTLRDAFVALDDHPRTDRARRAVDRTYLRGAVTQEAAAEVLDMAFSTYRRHLAAGIELLIDRLWRWEIYGRAD